MSGCTLQCLPDLPQQCSETNVSVGDMNRRACFGACAKSWWSEFPVVKHVHDIGRKRSVSLRNRHNSDDSFASDKSVTCSVTSANGDNVCSQLDGQPVQRLTHCLHQLLFWNGPIPALCSQPLSISCLPVSCGVCSVSKYFSANQPQHAACQKDPSVPCCSPKQPERPCNKERKPESAP